MKYRDEDIEKLLDTLKIEEIVGEVVELKRSGANYKGLCPFHNDSSPSFMVSPQKNISKCFVCGEGGNPITFYMKYHKLDFGTAVKELAKKYSVDMKSYGRVDSKRAEKYERLYEVMEEARDYFAEKIFSNEGREAFEYLNNRGFKADFIKENGIGFAPQSYDELISHMGNKGYKVEELIEVGLIKEGDRGYYTTFRNRIIFPITIPNGRIVAFGGRTLEDNKKVAKYLNSPETTIFHKGQNLYGIKERGNLIRKKSYAMLMEGYMDVLKAQSYGFDVALASLGTAFTAEQADLLKRYTSNVIIAYDMDSAGRKAVEATSLILKEKGFNIRVIEFGDAKDPDEYLDNFGRDKFLERVKESKEIFDFLYSYYAKNYNLTDLLAKQNFIGEFKSFFQAIDSELEKNLYLERLSKNLNIDKEILYDELIKNNKKVHKISIIKKYNNNGFSKPKEKKKKIDMLEEESLKLVIANPKLAFFFKEKNIKSPLLKKVIELIETSERYRDGKVLIEADELEEEEKQELFEYLSAVLTLDQIGTEKLYEEIYLSWFRKELASEIKNAKEEKNILRMLELKKVEDKLSNQVADNEYVKNLYKEFKNLV
jgi:DNA primase